MFAVRRNKEDSYYSGITYNNEITSNEKNTSIQNSSQNQTRWLLTKMFEKKQICKKLWEKSGGVPKTGASIQSKSTFQIQPDGTTTIQWNQNTSPEDEELENAADNPEQF